ncbi:hypothetical protein NDU88_006946 [Pleurodeles waltl]|uniref:Uncharacterized protein n=1 Tax=Pleurodeles waltl TaxID=8319 RepID=A0AAV7LTZ9_PLEWA|nr:hypothetical protein NDU88_006946 [Pleurodeles waltl]
MKGVSPALPRCPSSVWGDRYIPRSPHLLARVKSGASGPSAVRALGPRPAAQPLPGCHNASPSGSTGAGQARLACRPEQAVLAPNRRGLRAGAAAPLLRSVPRGYPAAAGQAQHSSPRLSLTARPRHGHPAAHVREGPRGPEIRTAAWLQPPTSPVCGTHGDGPGAGLGLADNGRPLRSRWIMRPPSWMVQPHLEHI